ncbi:MAG: hypothetical protein WA047_20545 [Phenylobacterium sp.]|uniref:hypothetical protein n=1 Tax=Phenylobacterium sp. TaxID=1871053 RepID=UPI003BB72A56
MPLTDAEASELLQLQDARLKLDTGRMPSRVVFQGHETDFAKIDRDRLEQRIGDLQTKSASSTGRTRRALRFGL